MKWRILQKFISKFKQMLNSADCVYLCLNQIINNNINISKMSSEISRVPSIDSIPEVDFIKETFAELHLQQEDDEVVILYIYISKS